MINLIKIALTSAKPPQFIEKANKDFIYYGEKNDYPQYLTELYKRSVMHSSIIDTKVKFIQGGGWKVNKQGISVADYSKLVNWLKDINDKDNLRELTFKVVQDIEMYNGVALEVVWNKAGTSYEINHIPFSYIRSNEDNTEFYYTKKWVKINYKGERLPNNAPEDEEDFETYKPYDENNRKGKQLFYYKVYYPELETYTLPNYLSAITSIDTEIRIDNFHNSFIRKGFSASHMVNFFNGVPTPEEQRKMKQKIKEELTGDDEAGSFILNFAVDKEHGSEVVTLTPANFDKQFEQLRQDVKDNILQRHGITHPSMVGVMVPGKLGGSTASEMKVGIEHFNHLYVKDRQRIVEDIFNELFKYEGEKVLELNTYSPVGIEWSEALIEKYLPKQAIAEMIAERVGVDLNLYKDIKPVMVEEKKEVNGEKMMLSAFGKYGYPKDDFEFLNSRDFEYTTDEELFNSEDEIVRMTFADTKKKEDSVDPNIGYTPKKAKIVAPELNVKTMYSYEFKAGFSDDGNSRAFCSDMMKLNRLYTKDDMKKINAEIRANDDYSEAFGDLNIDVWKHKGGWYRKPGTDLSVPQCRHTWKQNVVIRKKK